MSQAEAKALALFPMPATQRFVVRSRILHLIRLVDFSVNRDYCDRAALGLERWERPPTVSRLVVFKESIVRTGVSASSEAANRIDLAIERDSLNVV